MRGYRIKTYDESNPTLTEALHERRPTIVEVVVDPNELPLPARLELKYTENVARALIKGEPIGKRIALTLYRDKIRELER